MELNTSIRGGLPVLAVAARFSPGSPMRVTGTGFGDAEPPEPAEVEIRIEDPRRPGRPDRWREALITSGEWDRIENELIAMIEKEKR